MEGGRVRQKQDFECSLAAANPRNLSSAGTGDVNWTEGWSMEGGTERA